MSVIAKQIQDDILNISAEKIRVTGIVQGVGLDLMSGDWQTS